MDDEIDIKTEKKEDKECPTVLKFIEEWTFYPKSGKMIFNKKYGIGEARKMYARPKRGPKKEVPDTIIEKEEVY